MMEPRDVLDRLRHASAAGKVNADNSNYFCPVSIKDVDDAIAEIERQRDALQRPQRKHGLEEARQLIEELVSSLVRMNAMHDLMMKKVNHGASFYDAACIREMNEAPIQATKATDHAFKYLRPHKEENLA